MAASMCVRMCVRGVCVSVVYVFVAQALYRITQTAHLVICSCLVLWIPLGEETNPIGNQI